MTISISSGAPFSHPQNIEASSTSGSWTTLGSATEAQRVVEVQAIYYSGTAIGRTLVLRDAHENEWYFYTAPGTRATTQYLTTPLTLQAPFEYFDMGQSNSIVVFGSYV